MSFSLKGETMDEKNNSGINANELSAQDLNGVAGGAGPDSNGNYICPWCREYALKPQGDGKYHCSYCGNDFDHHF